MEVNGQFHAPADLTTGKIALGTQWVGGRVAPRAELD
jgi:hypothetical protein